MAPSQMEHQQEQSLGQGYTHKKFNCGYSHKKLGMRLRNRQEEQVESISQSKTTEQNKTAKSSKGLFRPYALDEKNTPRKRKVSRTSESSDEGNNNSYMNSPQLSPSAYHQLQQTSPVSTASLSGQSYSSPALSSDSYALRLQRQRAALYMRYMSQFQQTSSQSSATPLQTPSHYATMGYPNVTAPIFNGC